MKIQLPPPPYSYKGFSCFVRKNNPAFTLAEVLITLTIIGVIAALTVPNLINKVQDHGYRSAFLKNYALLQNAYAKSIRDGIPFWTGESDRTLTQPYRDDPSLLKDYFRIVRNTRYEGGLGFLAFSDIYTGSRSGKGSININSYVKNLNGENTSFLDDSSGLGIKLEDGTIIVFYDTYNASRHIFIDVNGAAKPNVIGRDIYFAQVILNSSTSLYQIYPYGYGRTGSCYKDSTGMSCAYEIVKNKSYVIPDKAPN